MRIIFLIILTLSLIAPASGFAESRFPHPEFESEYAQPTTEAPEPSESMVDYIDLILLAVALSVAAYLTLKTRSRKAIFTLMIICLAYFGFWRKGCICPVGSIQNVTAAITDSEYTISIAVLGFFILPLIFALFSGRSFCSGVCPLGAIQDIVILKPLTLPWQVTRTLSVIPYIYLGTAILLAGTGSGFIICRLDPFVSLFRLSGSLSMILLGAFFLLLGIFVARPYCRFLCPYGVLLSWASSFSKAHVTVTPGECIQCKLCEKSCPFDAIRKPVPTALPEEHEKAQKRLTAMMAVLPIVVILSGWLGSRLHVPLSQLNNTVILAEQIHAEDTGLIKETTLRSDAFRQAGESKEKLYENALNIRGRIKTGGWLFGGFVGLAIGCSLIRYSTRRTRTDYEPDRAECLSCGRCFSYCPVKKELKETTTSG